MSVAITLPPPAYFEIRVLIPARAAEAVANFLMEHGATGLVEEAAGGARRKVLIAPFASRARARAAALTVRRYLRALRAMGLLRGRKSVALRARRGGDWTENWKRYARPVRIGRRLLVRPSWARAAAPGGAATVTLDPGMAFGTGAHPTTRLCLEALVRHLAGGERVLDVGTGSGILAIAAAKLGARAVLALDTDALACRVARDNARRNGVAGRVLVRARGLAAAGAADRAFDVVVANLTAQDLGRLLPSLARRLRPGGLAVLSGILRGQEARVRRAARAAGLGWPLARRRAGWVVLEIRRPAARR